MSLLAGAETAADMLALSCSTYGSNAVTRAAATPPPQPPDITTLPLTVMRNIAQLCAHVDLEQARLANRRWARAWGEAVVSDMWV